MIRNTRPTPLATLALLVFAALTTAPAGLRAAELPEGWLTDWSEALRVSKEKKMPILAVFSAEWCGPCQRMIATVYPKPEVKKALSKWVHVYIDEEKDKKDETGLMVEFRIEAFPTFSLISAEGIEEDRFMGGRDAETFVRLLDEHPVIIAKIKELEKTTAEDPTNAQAWADLGFAYKSKERYDDAMQAWRRAAQNDKNGSTGVMDDLGWAGLQKMVAEEKYTDLMFLGAQFGDFEKTFPNSEYVPESMFMRSRIQAVMENFEASLEIMDEALTRYPKHHMAENMKNIRKMIQEQIDKRSGGEAAGPPAPPAE